MITTRPQPSIRALRELHVRFFDAIAGFELAADLASNSEFIRLARNSAENHRIHAEELASLIIALGGEPATDGSREASVHRAWIQLACRTFPRQDRRLPTECARGELELQRRLRGIRASGDPTGRLEPLLTQLREDVASTVRQLRQLRDARGMPVLPTPERRYATP